MRSTSVSGFLLPLGFCFLVLFHGCLAQLVPCGQQRQSSRLSGCRSECQIDRITAREPNRREVSEAGVSEFWDSGENDELDCAGVEVVRHTINPKGLLLPYYPNTHELVYVVRGRGIQGTVISGCPETFETSFSVGGGRDQQFFDKHQRVYRYKEGDVLTLPAGAVHWTYNDGETPIVTINLRDTSNVANQLDRNFRKFFLAGNPQSQRQDHGGQRPWGIPPQHEGRPYPGEQPSRQPWGPSERPGQQRPWETRPGQETSPSEQPWGPSQRPSQQHPWGTKPGQETRPSQQPWGPSQRPGQETGPSQRPWEAGPSQRPWEARPGYETGPFEQPWGSSQRPWETRPGRETHPSQQPWGPSQQPWGPSQRPSTETGPFEQPWGPSQRPSQETSPSKHPWATRPGQETSPTQRPWEIRPGQGTSPFKEPWGPSQRPGQETGPSQRPWGTIPGQETGPSEQPWGPSQHPGQESGPSQRPWESRPGQETGPSKQPWGPSQRPGQETGPSQRPWETKPGQGTRPSEQPWGPSQHPGQETRPSQRPWGTGPFEQPWGPSQRPDQETKPSQRPWETRPGQGGTDPYKQPWGPSQHPGQEIGPSQRPWETKPGEGTRPSKQPWGPSERPWGTSKRPGKKIDPSEQPWGPSQHPGQGSGTYEQPWGSSPRPGQEIDPSKQPWGTSERPGQGSRPSQRPSEQPWGTPERPGQGTGPSKHPFDQPWGTSERPGQGTGSSQHPWGTTERPGKGTGPSQRPWGTSERPGKQEDPCEICRRIRGELGLGDPCANCNNLRIQEQESFNMFSGFDNEILQEVFDVEYNTIWKLQGQNDDRGLIVYAENFQVNVPEKQEQEERKEMSLQQGTRGIGMNNSIATTICATQLSANIANPAHADVYNPRGGRISSLNSHKLPILNLLQLSAERGVLYKNAVLAPHYNLNAHSIIYVTSGNSRLQIVRNDGSLVFDDVVREGQLIVVPQDFAVVKKAGEQGCEWVAFKTNNNAVTTQLAGRFSFIRSLPVDVLVNSYDISREQAKNLKYNRQEGVVLSPSRTRSTMKNKAKNALLNALFG